MLVGKVGSWEELVVIIGMGYAAGKAVVTVVSRFLGWLRKKSA